MTEVVDYASAIEAAQQAAASSDFFTAERLLREAAAIQESTLGTDHPDLASTLNNLAFVCERTNNIADAERYYRRAHAIAVASLGPRHPFVATSIKNLVDFCAAHDIPIWTPPGASAGMTAATSDRTNPAPDSLAEFAEESEEYEKTEQPATVARSPLSRTLALAAIGVSVIVAVAFTMRSREAQSSASAAPVLASTEPAPARDAAPAIALDSTPTAPAARIERPASRANTEAATPREKTVTPQAVTVLTARLCGSLEKRGSPDWQCSSPSGDLRAGTYSFYTRLMTSAGTTVEHRWYHDGRVHQVMRLRISANPIGGYRTFSSNTISPERAGDWTVELRAADGTLLHEERFAVR